MNIKLCTSKTIFIIWFWLCYLLFKWQTVILCSISKLLHSQSVGVLCGVVLFLVCPRDITCFLHVFLSSTLWLRTTIKHVIFWCSSWWIIVLEKCLLLNVRCFLEMTLCGYIILSMLSQLVLHLLQYSYCIRVLKWFCAVKLFLASCIASTILWLLTFMFWELLFYCEISFNYIIGSVNTYMIYMSETSIIKMLSLRNYLSRFEQNFVALAKLMRYILRYTVKYWCNIVNYQLY